jgi:hypothetical protein
LQYGYVLSFDPATNKYKVAYRDGLCGFKSDVDLKAATKYTEDVVQGLHKTYSFGDAAVAMQEPLVMRVVIPESQASNVSSKETWFEGGDWNALWDAATPNEMPTGTVTGVNSLVRATKPSVNKGERTSTRRLNLAVINATDQEGTLKPRTSKQNYQEKRKAQNAGSRWTVGKIKVATFTGNNPKYPLLKATRTGWVGGLLTSFKEGESKPYTIEWDTDPKIVSHVDTDEMFILRRDFMGSDKRRLLDMVCVGSEVLVPRAIKGQTRGAEQKYGTVMFYDLAIKGFKVLCRDGYEKWVDPEDLDELIVRTSEESLEMRRIAVNEPWAPGVATIVQKYGLYCVRQFGPDGKASDVDRENDPLCIAPPLVPHTEAQGRTNEPGTDRTHSLVADVPIWSTGQIVCFVREGQGASKKNKKNPCYTRNGRAK